MKKIIYFLLTFFSIFLIYNKYNKKLINYISFNDNLGSYYYNEMIKDYLINENILVNYNVLFNANSINSLIRDINNNKTIRYNNKDYFLKKELRESDILVISIGEEELSKFYDKYDMNKNYYNFGKMFLEIKSLIKEITKYAKGKIFFLGYYNPTNYYDSKTDELFYKIDTKLYNLMMDNNINYIDLYEIVKGNNYKSDEIHLNSNGNKQIMDIISVYLK